MSTHVSLGRRILAMALSIVMVLSAVPASVFSVENTLCGKVTALTAGGVVNDTDPANVEVVIEETTLEYVEENELHAAGHWVGIKVEAPEGYNQATATYRVKSKPSDSYGESKSFLENADGANKDYIELWFRVTPESLIKFIKEDRCPTMMYAFNWDGEGEHEQEITFKLVPSEKIVLKKDGAVQYPYAVEYGTVSPLTAGGVVNSTDPANVSVKIEETTVEYVEGNALHSAGWWVGIKMQAPANAGELSTYKVKKQGEDTYGAAKRFKDYADGTEKDHIELWFDISPEKLAEGKELYRMYTFDWNGDALYEQEVNFRLTPSEKIVLKKDGAVTYPPLEVSVTASDAVNTVETTHYYNKEQKLTLTAVVTGVVEGGSYQVVGTANDGADTWNFVPGENGVYTYTYTGKDATGEGSLANIKVTVTDETREAQATLTDTYVYDAVAPTLVLTVTDKDAAKSVALENRDGKSYIGVADPAEKVTFKIYGNVNDTNYQGGEILIEQECLRDTVTAIEVSNTVVDLAGNKLASVEFQIGESKFEVTCDKNGMFTKNLYADLQKPYSDKTSLEIVIQDKDGNTDFSDKFYNKENLQFKAQIIDGDGVGIEKVGYYVGADEKGVKFVQKEKAYYYFPLDQLTGTNDATLHVVAYDKLGNKNSKSVSFHVDTDAPEIAITMPTAPVQTVAGVAYYDAEQTVTIQVTDTNLESRKSRKVTYQINGEEKQGTWVENTCTITIADGEVFSNLKVEAADKAGNQSTKTEAAVICVDTTDPEIVITMPTAPVQTVAGVAYYDAEQTVTIQVTDTNLESRKVTYQINGEEKQGTWVENTCTITIADGEVFSNLKVEAADKAGRQSTKTEAAVICVDTTDPEIVITMPTAPVQTSDGVEYYDAEQTVTIQVTDTNLESRKVTYQINGEEKQGTWEENTCTITIADGEVFSNLKVEAADKAKNESTKTEAAVICVDTTDPEIVITMPAEPALTFDGVEYYDAKQTVTIQVTDTNLESRKVTYQINGEEKQGTWEENTCTITIADGEVFSNLKVEAADKAKNESVKTETEAVICVDTTVPEAVLDVSGEGVTDVYVRKDGIIFVKLENPTVKESGVADDASDKKVTLTVTVSDTNLSQTENNKHYYVHSSGEKTGVVNGNTITYTWDLTVKADQSGYQCFDLTVADLAGNWLKEFTKVTINGNESNALKEAIAISNGAFNGTIALDRRRPGSNEEGVPVIEVTTPGNNPTTSSNGLDLFAGAFDYNASITDKDTGLALVTWSVKDANGVVAEAKNKITPVDNGDIQIPVSLKEELGETNAARLTIVAQDNAGNIIQYQKDFAVDSKAPVVTVTKSVEEGKQFVRSVDGEQSVDLYNGKVTYTVDVKDINLTQCNLTYTIEGKETYSLTVDNKTVQEIVLNDGDVLKNITIQAIDNANNPTTEVTVVDADGKTAFAYDATTNTHTYTGNYVAADKTAPTVTVTKSVEEGKQFVRSVEGEKSVDLYTGEVTYTVQVKDLFLTRENGAVALVRYKLEGDTQWNVLDLFDGAQEGNSILSHNEDVLKTTFTLHENDVLVALEVEVKDNAANAATTVNVVDADGKTAFAYDAATNIHTYTGNYATVDYTAPAVTVTKSVESSKQFVQSIDGEKTVDLYNGQVTYTVEVKDLFLTRENGAVAQVRFKLEGDTEWRVWNLFDGAQSGNSILSHNEDVFTRSFAVANGNVLVAMEVEVKDNAGNAATEVAVVDANDKTAFVYDATTNIHTYTGNYVAADKTAPTVTVTKSVEDGKQFVQTIDVDTTEENKVIDFYDGEVTYTVTVEDLFLTRDLGAVALVRYMLEGDTQWNVLNLFDGAQAENSIQSNNTDVFTTSFQLRDGETLVALEVEVQDNAGNATEETISEDALTPFTGMQYTGNYVRVDKTAPKVQVEKIVEAEKNYIKSSEKTDYYNGEVTYKVTATDINLTNVSNGTQKLQLTYRYEGDEAESVIVLPAADDGWFWEKNADGEDSYIYEFTVKDGKVLTQITVEAIDNAGNRATAVEAVDADNKTAFTNNDGVLRYNGKLVAVDKTAPVVTVEKTGTSVQSYDGYDYYDAPISYKVTVKDAFLNKLEGSVAKVIVTYMDGTKSKEIDLLSNAVAFGEKESDLDSFEAVFEAYDGDAILDIQIIAIDNADNSTKEVGVTDTDDLTAFAYVEQTRAMDYTGNIPVVDMTKPVAKVEITGEIVDSFYTYDGVTYVKLKNPGSAQSGALTNQGDETVTLKVTASDNNLTLDTANKFGVKNNLDDGIAWAGTPAKNVNSDVTFTKSVTVPADSTGTIEFELTVFDLAGNAIEEVRVASINETDSTKINEQVQPQNGVFGTTISLDRRRPSSVDDSNAPVIKVEASIPYTTANNDVDLFNSAFSFALDVTDGQKSAHNSGIDKVRWSIKDAQGVVKLNETINDLQDGVYNQSFTIPVELMNAIGESNDVELTISATDNVGNTTEYIKQFGVDTQKPVVVIAYDNNSVMNDKYFKADRTVTITVSDINFEPTTTTITSEVNATGWNKNGDVYTATCTYTVDGIYTLDMATTDRANNTADIDFTNNNTNAAPTDFVLDKTAPVIDVEYNPANPVDRDNNGVQYFDANRRLNVTITEVNFDPANQTTKLVADLGASNALGAWTHNGNVHTASETFTEGNNYQVKIDYTDLAGNPAVGYSSETFSVDLGEPTIAITSGEMTTSSLNIVQNDLVLGFTINDKQNNLKSFEATLLFLDNEFKQQEVKGSAYYTEAGKNDRTTGTITFTNIAKEKANDGIYTVQITAEDYAGHKVTLSPELVFSLNRFGSTFSAEDAATREFLTAAADGNVYRDRASSLKIIERNPNRVYQAAESKEEGSLITISVNGNSTQLRKGVDYLMEISEKGTGTSKWLEYTYEIMASNFFNGDTQIDGRYEILFYSVDAAGNSNTNESNEGSNIQTDTAGNYTGKLSFMLDHKAPVVSILNLNEKGGTTFDAAFKRIPISVSDNTPCTIEVYIDGVLVKQYETMEGLLDAENWLASDGQGGYVLNISASDAPQDVRVVIKDAAGNEIEQYRQRVLVSDSFWVRYINNYWAVGGTIVGLLALVFVIILLAKKYKKKEDQ